ncbi:MAG: hypothetical protein ACK40M_04380, partial [Flavobacteriales bacterium]
MVAAYCSASAQGGYIPSGTKINYVNGIKTSRIIFTGDTLSTAEPGSFAMISGVLYYKDSTAWKTAIGTGTGSGGEGFESLGNGYGLGKPNDSTYVVDSTLITTKADRHHLKDSLINVLNLRTIQNILDASNLITNPSETIENDPSNTSGTFGIKQGVGGSRLGDLLVGYRNNRFINSNSSASYLAGFYSSIDTLTAFGSLRKAPSVGIGTLLNNTKWQHVVIDSNEVKIVADSVNMTGRIKVSGQVRIGTVSGGIVAPSTSTQLPLVIARNSAGPNGLVGVYAYGSGTKAGSIGSITMQNLGIFTGDQTDQVLLDVNGGTAFGKSPGGGTPVDGLMVKGRTRLNDTLQLTKAFVSSSSSDSVLVKDATGYVKSAVPLSSLSGGTGLVFGRTDTRNNTGAAMAFSVADQDFTIDSAANFGIYSTVVDGSYYSEVSGSPSSMRIYHQTESESAEVLLANGDIRLIAGSDSTKEVKVD